MPLTTRYTLGMDELTEAVFEFIEKETGTVIDRGRADTKISVNIDYQYEDRPGTTGKPIFKDVTVDIPK